MKKLFVFGTISLMVLVVILSGCAVGKATATTTSQIKANSCDADSVCEVAKTISTPAGSTSALMLTSDVKAVMVDGSLSAGTVNAGSVTIVGKTISTLAGSTSALILTFYV